MMMVSHGEGANTPPNVVQPAVMASFKMAKTAMMVTNPTMMPVRQPVSRIDVVMPSFAKMFSRVRKVSRVAMMAMPTTTTCAMSIAVVAAMLT
jgi:hypothetical protein